MKIALARREFGAGGGGGVVFAETHGCAAGGGT